MSKFISFVSLIAFGPRRTAVNPAQQAAQEHDELLTQLESAADLETLGRRLDGTRAAYWAAMAAHSTGWATFHWQTYEQLAVQWKRAMEFYSNPKNSQIMTELGSANLV